MIGLVSVNGQWASGQLAFEIMGTLVILLAVIMTSRFLFFIQQRQNTPIKKIDEEELTNGEFVTNYY